MSEDSATQPSPGRDVFVSYASQDSAIANAIVATLERNGLKWWMPPARCEAGRGVRRRHRQGDQ